MPESREALLVGKTASIVAAFVARNTISPSQLPALIEAVHGALIAGITPPNTTLRPAVPITQSVHANFLFCLECGKKLSSLRRHIMAAHKFTPDKYRERWQLSAHYPMVAPSFAAMRSLSAFEIWRERRIQRDIR